MNKVTLLVSTILPIIVAAGTAHAEDLTGTWSGGAVCTLLSSVIPGITKDFPRTMTISQSGTSLTAEFVQSVPGPNATGNMHDVSGKPGLATFTLLGCDNDNTLAGPSSTVYVGTVKFSGAKAKMKGTSIHSDDGISYVCKFKYERTSAADPGATGCS